MGRPALGVRATQIRLTEEDRARIEALVGARGMSAFIREAIRAELDRREDGDQPSPNS